MQISLKNILFEIFWVISFFWVYGSIINIYFSILDAKYNIYEYYSVLNDGPRLSIAILLVVFPIFLAMSVYRRRYIVKNSQIDANPKSKYSVYLIDFILILTFVSTFITVVYKFLGGEFTNLFLLKCLLISTVTFISGLYFYAINKQEVIYRKVTVYSAVGLSLLLVTFALVFYVKVFGTPEYMRNVKKDEETISVISQTKFSINNYYTQKKTLPKDLSFTYPKSEELTYTVIDAENYELCADFREEKNIDSKNYMYDFNSNHPAGNKCYKFNVFNY